jgi:hypothetical protein
MGELGCHMIGLPATERESTWYGFLQLMRLGVGVKMVFLLLYYPYDSMS